jgi:hypothetical protein
LLLAWSFTACGDQRQVVEDLPLDSAALAERETRRQAFLEEQAAKFAEQAALDRRLSQPVIVSRPTVVFFFPGVLADSSPLQTLIRAAADSARAIGWDYTERYAGALRIMDSSARAIYAAPVARDSTGIALVAPGYPPQVRYGFAALLDLSGRLRALDAWLRAQASQAKART